MTSVDLLMSVLLPYTQRIVILLIASNLDNEVAE